MTGQFKTTVEFCVLEIPTSFNLLLERPWLHRSDVMGVTSTLHQKLILGLDSGILIIHGDFGICPHSEDNSPLLEIMHGEEDIAMGGFAVVTEIVCTIRADDGFLVSSEALEIMQRMNYKPGMGLGRDQQGVSEFPQFFGSNERFGLGYVPKKSDPLKRWRNRARARVVEKKPVGEKIPYQGQPEPYFDTETKKEYPGFEIFVEDT